jgi:hypothetical protein
MHPYSNIGSLHALQALGLVKTASKLDVNAHREILDKIKNVKASGPSAGDQHTRQIINQLVDGIKKNPALAIGAAIGTVYGLASLQGNQGGYPEMEPYYESMPPMEYYPRY